MNNTGNVISTAYIVDISKASEDIYDYYHKCTYDVFTDSDIRINFGELMDNLIESFNIIFDTEISRFISKVNNILTVHPQLKDYIQVKWFSWSDSPEALANGLMDHLQLFYYELGSYIFRYVPIKDQAAYVLKYKNDRILVVLEYLDVQNKF